MIEIDERDLSYKLAKAKGQLDEYLEFIKKENVQTVDQVQVILKSSGELEFRRRAE